MRILVCVSLVVRTVISTGNTSYCLCWFSHICIYDSELLGTKYKFFIENKVHKIFRLQRHGVKISV